MRTLLKGVNYVNGCFEALLVRNIRFKPRNEVDFKLQIRAEKLLRIKLKNKKVYNPLTAKGDMWGKKYLVDLYKAGYPVIPSAIKEKKGIMKLPEANKYVIKPFFGYSNWGIKTVSKNSLKNIILKDEIIQPAVQCRYEIAFYVIDGLLNHSLVFNPDKFRAKRPRTYNPTQKDKDFVNMFVKWNGMKYGIQRIDAFRLPDGSLMLIEIEDLSPSIGLRYVNEAKKNEYIKKLVKSFLKNMF